MRPTGRSGDLPQQPLCLRSRLCRSGSDLPAIFVDLRHLTHRAPAVYVRRLFATSRDGSLPGGNDPSTPRGWGEEDGGGAHHHAAAPLTAAAAARAAAHAAAGAPMQRAPARLHRRQPPSSAGFAPSAGIAPHTPRGGNDGPAAAPATASGGSRVSACAFLPDDDDDPARVAELAAAAAADRSRLADWGFDVASAPPAEQRRLLLFLLHDLGLVARFDIPAASAVAFLREAEDAYSPDVPFHNCGHAAQVAVAVGRLLSASTLRESLLEDIDVLALVLAAICHDWRHKGTTKCVAEGRSTGSGLKGSIAHVTHPMIQRVRDRHRVRPRPPLQRHLGQREQPRGVRLRRRGALRPAGCARARGAQGVPQTLLGRHFSHGQCDHTLDPA